LRETTLMDQTKFRFAVIGYGNIGRRHCEVIAAHDACELVAVVDIDETLQAEIKTKYNAVFFNSLDALFLSSLDVDVVSICTANYFHTQQALQALNYYCHVVVEKPMGLKAVDCTKVIALSKEVDRKVFCVMQNRYSPPSQWLRSIVDQGILGNIFQVQINCFWNRDNRYYHPGGWRGTKEFDGGPLFTQFSHFVDLLYWLFGDVIDIQARFANFNHLETIDFEDSGFVTFEFAESGALGAFNYSICAFEQNLESSITILAENGTIRVSGQYMEKVEYCRIKNYQMPELPLPDGKTNHRYIIDNVVNTLQGHSVETTNAIDGMKVVDIIERIYALR
jgi:UDP-N-acetyl-2-amino-2-deoxyglucuronate dehydrogenase